MNETPERLVERLRDEGAKTYDFFQALPPEQLDQTVYSDGACWNVRQLLAHFVATEIAITRLMENILAGSGGVPEAFDIDAFNEQQVDRLQALSLPELLDRFQSSRQASIALVTQMSAADLQRTGRHPYLGVTSLEEIIKLLYRHIQIHQRDVRKRNSAASTV